MNPMPNTIETSFAGTPNTFPQPINSTRQDLFSQSFPSDVEVIQMPDGGPDTIMQDENVDFINLDADEIDFASSIEIPQTEFSDANPLNDVFEQFEPTSDLTDENIILENSTITEPTETPEVVDINLDADSDITLDTLAEYNPYTDNEIENPETEEQIDLIAEPSTELEQNPLVNQTEIPTNELETQDQLTQAVERPKLFTDLSETQPIETAPILEQLNNDPILDTNNPDVVITSPEEYTQITQALYDIPNIINTAVQLESVSGVEALTFTHQEVSSLINTTPSIELINVVNNDILGATNPQIQQEVTPIKDQALETILNNMVEKSERILEQKAQLLDLSQALSQSQDLTKSSEQLSLAINASIANASRIASLPIEVTQSILNLNPDTQAYQDVKNNLLNPTENSIELIIASLNANSPQLNLKTEVIVLEMVTTQYKFEIMEILENFDSSIRISPEATDEEVQNLRAIYLDLMREIKLESQDKTKVIDFEAIYERLMQRIEKEKDKLPKDFAMSFVHNGQLYPVIRGDQSFIIFEPNIDSEDVKVEMLKNNKGYGFYTRKDLLQDVEEGKQHSSVLTSGKILTISSESQVNLNPANQDQILKFYEGLVKVSQSEGEDKSKYSNTIQKHSIDLDGQPVQFIENWITNPFKKVVVRAPQSKEIYNEYGQPRSN